MGKFLVLFLVIVPLWAQDQGGSVAIAESVFPSTENTVGNFTDCVEKLMGLDVPSPKAINACNGASKIAAKEKIRGWNNAADATKASRPVVIVSRYGGYGGGYYGRSYYSRPYYSQPRSAPAHRPTSERRSAPKRQATPECPATPPSPSSRR